MRVHCLWQSSLRVQASKAKIELTYYPRMHDKSSRFAIERRFYKRIGTAAYFCAPCGIKLSEAELMQYRSPVGRGPSGNTCPRCDPQVLQTTSTRRIP